MVRRLSEIPTGPAARMDDAPRIDLGGGVAVHALLDAVADHPRRLEDAFHGVPDGGWDDASARHPATVGRYGRWRLAVYAFLVTTPRATVLVDAGVGPRGTVAAEWLDTGGDLMRRLDAIGVPPASIDILVFTHLHEDHVGWASDPEGELPRFARARHVLSELEWARHDERRLPPHVAEALGPVVRSGRLEAIAPGDLTAGVELLALPGHTSGHAGVVVTGSSGSALLAGDVFNHPVQVGRPGIVSGADADPEQAARTRRAVVERARAESLVVGSAHLPGGWWRVAVDGGVPRWDAQG